jgi:hypothetical protein
MANVYFDFRGMQVRVLIASGNAVKYCRSFAIPPESGAHPVDGDRQSSLATIFKNFHKNTFLNELVAQVTAESGEAVTHAHVILPWEAVAVSNHTTPRIPLPDAEKIVARELIAATGDEQPVFHISPIGFDLKHQSFVAEYIHRDRVKEYIKLFAGCRVALTTLTTSLHANLAAFSRQRELLTGVQAIIDINSDVIEACYVNSSEMVHYEKLVIPPADTEGQEENEAPESERSQRRRIFGIANSLYTIHSHYMAAGNTQVPVEKVWLCGMECSIPGITDALSEAMGITVVLANETMPDGHAYTGLLGFADAVDRGAEVNFILPVHLKKFSFPRKKIVATVLGIYALIMMAVLFVAENNYRSVRKELELERQNLRQLQTKTVSAKSYARNLESLKTLQAKEVAFYDIFRELANQLPASIYIERIGYKKNEKADNFELVFIAGHSPALGNSREFTKLRQVLDGIKQLKNHHEPEITVVEIDHKKLVRIKFICDIIPEGNH